MLFINGAKKRAPAAASELLKLLKKYIPPLELQTPAHFRLPAPV